MALIFEIAGHQIDGARDYQEDAFLITNLGGEGDEKGALIVVADGMGGHAAGNVASNMALQAFNKHFTKHYPFDDITKVPEILRECVIKGNDAIKETTSETAALQGMGCTLVAALLMSGKMWWTSVGDSHLYLIKNKELIKKNADHSYGGFLDRMAAEGKKVEPDPSISRNMLMSALTGADIADIDVSQEPYQLEENDSVVVCSDGMDTLSHGAIIQYTDWGETPKEVVDSLLKAVEDAGKPRQDNTTVVAARVIQKTAEQAAALGGEVPASDYEPPPASKRKGPGMAIVAVLAVLLIGGGIAADYVLGLGILFAKKGAPVAVVDEQTGADEAGKPAGDAESAGAAQGEDKSPKELAPGIATTKPAKKGPHRVVQFKDTFKNGQPAPELVTIPAGEFKMGSKGVSTDNTDKPRHTVAIKEFAITTREITYTEYEQFTKSIGRKPPHRSEIDPQIYPVVNISWQEALDYAAWLSRKTGKTYRLPSEAEWEYMARATKITPYWWGFDMKRGAAHCISCGSEFDLRKAAPIGSFDPNPWGVYDTSGNVSEWVMDCWNENYKGAPTDGNAWNEGDCSQRVVRGGSFINPATGVTNNKRNKFSGDTRLDHIGFRLVREK